MDETSSANSLDNSSTSMVRLLIKASNQQFDDHIIESDLMWTVKHLKVQLSQSYPSKPPVADQKLIYSGQLLNDTLQLKDVLRSYKDVYTHNHIFHLVYTPKHLLTSNNSKSKSSLKTALNMNANNGGSNSSTDGLRQRHAAQTQQNSNQQQHQQQQPTDQTELNGLIFGVPSQYMTQMMAAGVGQCPQIDLNNPQAMPFSFPGQINMQVMANQQAAMYNWMQQVYSQYMEQCLRFTNSSAALMSSHATTSQAAAGSSFPSPHPTGFPYPPNPFFQQLPYLSANAQVNPVISLPSAGAAVAAPTATAAPAVAAAVPPEAAPAQQQAVQPRFPNIVQEEQENRDWLDSLFSITRLALFLTILYFNSSPLRCLLVVFIAGAIYLYHIGVFRLRPNERNNNNINRNNNAAADQIRQGVQQVQEAQAAQQQQQDDNPINAEAVEGEPAAAAAAAAVASNNADQTTPAAAAAEIENEDNNGGSMISFVRTFVVTFFTSLLPETPAAL